MRLPRARAIARVGAGVGTVAITMLAGTALAAGPDGAADPPEAPAAAPPASADLELAVAGRDVVLQPNGKPFLVKVHNNGPDAAAAFKVTIDTGGLDTTKVDVDQEAKPCDVVAAKSVCQFAGLANGANLDPFQAVLITPKAGLLGSAGSFTVEISSDTPDPAPQNNKKVTVPVSVKALGYDLSVLAYDVYGNDDTRAGVAPGGTANLTWAIFNHGNIPAVGVKYSITLPKYTSFAKGKPAKGCTYRDNRRVLECQHPTRVLQPEKAIQPRSPMAVKVAANAPGPVPLTGGVVSGFGISDQPKQGGVSILAADDDGLVVTGRDELKKIFRDIDRSDNQARFTVFTGPNKADLAITATKATGKVGETVEVTLDAVNKGPADSARNSVAVTVHAPAGTEITATPPDCVAVVAGTEYRCALAEFSKDATWRYMVKLKITSATVAPGRVTIAGTAADPNPANNTAAVEVTVTPAPTPSGSSSATPPPTGTTPPRPGGLPVTGGQTALMAFTGLATVAVGVVLLVLARRRRAVRSAAE